MEPPSKSFELIPEEVGATVSARKQEDIELTAALDRLTIELEALKMAVELYHPGISKIHAKLREEARLRTRKEHSL
jgi:hypothetical protein